MLKEKRHREIAGVFIALLGILLFLSLVSFNIKDEKALAANQALANLIGPFGVWAAHFLRTSFGYCSYWFVVIVGMWSWYLITDSDLDIVLERVYTFVYLMIVLSMLFSLIKENSLPQFAGGYIGFYLTGFFKKIFGNAGSWLLVVILTMAGLIFLGIVSLSSLFVVSFSKGEKLSMLLKSLITKKKMKKSGSAPQNSIAELGDKSIKRKTPWITKEKVKIKNVNKTYTNISNQNEPEAKLVELPDFANTQQKEEPENPYLLPDVLINNLSARTGSERKLDNSPLNNEQEARLELKIDQNYENKENFIIENEGQISTESIVINDAIECKQIQNDDIKIIDDQMQNVEVQIEVPEINYYDADETINDLRDEELDANLKDEVKINTIDQEVVSNNKIRFTDIEECVKEDIENTKVSIENNPETVEQIVNNEKDNKQNINKNSEKENIFKNEESEPANDVAMIPINEDYIIPMHFLHKSVKKDRSSWKAEIQKNSELLVKTLNHFGIESKVVTVNRGPVIALYELQIAPGIKVNRIVGLSDDIAMALAASRVRIVAPIPGKSAIGIEVPNREREMVTMGDILGSDEFKIEQMVLKVGLGKDILGNPIMLDLKKQPHLLIAGATGAGKSVCVNTIITSLLYNYDPNTVRFIMVDPKMVELQLYNGLPHQLTPVITDPDLAPKALKWAIYEMERRYQLLSDLNTRDIERYNQKISSYKGQSQLETLPYIVIIVDELADLMMVAPKEIENYITRIAQKARAVGIHLVLATQRPSVDVITGIIKANFPARIAFQVAQKNDSRTIIDQNGAEKLLGKGDLLYMSPMSSYPIRIQGAFVAEDEVVKLVRYARKFGTPHYIDIEGTIAEKEALEAENVEDEDELFVDAIKIIEETRKASASYLQRRLSIGYNRAARIIERMEEMGYIGPPQGSKPREVLI